MHPQYGSKYNTQNLNNPNQSMHSGVQQVAGNLSSADSYYNYEKIFSGVGVSNPTPHQHHHHHHGNYLHDQYSTPSRNSDLLEPFDPTYDTPYHKKHGTPNNLIAAMAMATAAGNGRG